MSETITATLPNGQPLVLELRLCSAPETLLERDELADRLQVDKRLIAKLEKEGLPAIRIGPSGRLIRYSWSQVMAWFAANGGKNGK